MTIDILTGDCNSVLETLDARSMQCCITSPPYYGLRCYDIDGQMGLEDSIDAYVAGLVAVFRRVHRVLSDDGVLWINLGDSYAREPSKGGSGPGGKNIRYSDSYTRAQTKRTGLPEGTKPKDLLMIPFEVARALRADGWYLRSKIIWHKPNAMPEPVRDRPVSCYEEVFLFSKSERYRFDPTALAETGADGQLRNGRNVWAIPTTPSGGIHVAPFPVELASRCIRSGSRPGDHILDPFGGSGTTGIAAHGLGRHATLIELNPEFAAFARARLDRSMAAAPRADADTSAKG